MIGDGTSRATVSPDEALQRLVDGNARFRRGETRFPTVQKEVLAQLAKGQRPYATILGCSDSRVPPEIIFNAGLGELFVVRVAGNVLSPEVSGSLEYAGAVLNTSLFVVLGHEACGAVQATLDTKLYGIQQRSQIQILVDDIMPGLADLDLQAAPPVQLTRAVEANVRWTMRQIADSPEGEAEIAAGRLKLVGGIYEIRSGGVRFL
jgi:carbonic anhydrase